MRLFAFLLSLLTATIALADVVHLKDGRKLEGEIVSETEDNIHIKMSLGALTVDRSDIVKIEKKPLPKSDKKPPDSKQESDGKTPDTKPNSDGTSPDTKQNGSAVKAVLPDYRIIENKKHDSPIKSQVVMRALVSGQITEEGLKALLGKLYDSAIARRDFKYHDCPTNVFIYLYTSRENAETGSAWIAMLGKGKGDKPRISVKKAQMKLLGKKPQVKFGLSEDKRKAVFKEAVAAQDRAMREADSKYPPEQQAASKEIFLKSIEYQRMLSERYERQVAKKHGLTRKQFKQITIEGVTKEWPMPKLDEADQPSNSGPAKPPARATTPDLPRSTPAQSAPTPDVYVTKPGYLACPSLGKMKKLMDFLVADDLVAAERYMQQNPDIIELKTGLEVHVTDSSGIGWVKIRPRGHLIEVWTVREAIDRR